MTAFRNDPSDTHPGVMARVKREGVIPGEHSCYQCARSAFSELLYCDVSVDVSQASRYYRERPEPYEHIDHEADALAAWRYPNLALPPALPRIDHYRRYRFQRNLGPMQYVFLDASADTEASVPWPDLQDLPATGKEERQWRAFAGSGERRLLGHLLFYQPLLPPERRRSKLTRFLGKQPAISSEIMEGSRAVTLLQIAQFIEEESVDGEVVVMPDFRVLLPLDAEGRAERITAEGVPVVFCEHDDELAPAKDMSEMLISASLTSTAQALFSLSCLNTAVAADEPGQTHSTYGPMVEDTGLTLSTPRPEAPGSVQKTQLLQLDMGALAEHLDDAGAQTLGLAAAMEECAGLFV